MGERLNRARTFAITSAAACASPTTRSVDAIARSRLGGAFDSQIRHACAFAMTAARG